MLNAEEETHIEQLQSCGRHALFKDPIVFDDYIDLLKLAKEGQLKKKTLISENYKKSLNSSKQTPQI